MNCTTSTAPRRRQHFKPQLFRLMNELSQMDGQSPEVHAKSARQFRPASNILEHQDFYTIELSLPGYYKNEILIKIDQNHLLVNANVEDNLEEKFHLREFVKTNFEKKFKLGDTIKTDKVDAKFDNGILRITLYKKEEQKPKTILID